MEDFSTEASPFPEVDFGGILALCLPVFLEK